MPTQFSFSRPVGNFGFVATWLLPMLMLHAAEPDMDVTPEAAQRIEAPLLNLNCGLQRQRSTHSELSSN